MDWGGLTDEVELAVWLEETELDALDAEEETVELMAEDDGLLDTDVDDVVDPGLLLDDELRVVELVGDADTKHWVCPMEM